MNGNVPRWFLYILAMGFVIGSSWFVRDVYASVQDNSRRTAVLETKIEFLVESNKRILVILENKK